MYFFRCSKGVIHFFYRLQGTKNSQAVFGLCPMFIFLGADLSIYTNVQSQSSQWWELELGWVGCLHRVYRPNPLTLPLENMDLRVGPVSLEQMECGVGTSLAAATQNGGSPNFTGAYGAWKFGVCWTNRAGVRVDVAADK